MDLPESPALLSTAAVLRAAAEPLPILNDPAFGAVFDRFAQSRIVLDLLPVMPPFMGRVCSGYAPGWGVLQTPSV